MDTHKLVQDTYNKIAIAYNNKWGVISPFFEIHAKKFISFLPKSAKILDLGCGAGRDSKYFFDNGLHVVGVDFSEGMLDIAKKIVPKAKFLCKDFRKLDFEKEKFDGIWSFFSILHLKRNELPPLLKKLNDSLKTKGILFIATKAGKGEIIETEHLDKDLQMFETFFSKRELADLLEKSNFKILEINLANDRKESDDQIVYLFAQKV
jgi:SAM-dependent methyltransferase